MRKYCPCLLSSTWILLAVGFAQSPVSVQQTASKPTAKSSTVKNKSKKLLDGRLQRAQTVTSTEVTGMFASPLKCDADGNLYVKTGPSEVRKFNSKGEQLASFGVSSTPDFKVDAASYFNASPNGELYAITFVHEITRYVFVYKSDGTLSSQIKLQPGFAWSPNVVAVFPSGQLLISGQKLSADENVPRRPFTGIFAADGQLLKEVKLEDGDAPQANAKTGEGRASSAAAEDSQHPLHGQLEMAADGNAYLMTGSTPPVFYVILAGGEIIRHFAVDPGASNYRPESMHIFQNRIAILFVGNQTENQDKIMKVVDLEGREIAKYEEPYAGEDLAKPAMGLAFACYTENPERFTFIGTANDDNKLQFWIAEPR